MRGLFPAVVAASVSLLVTVPASAQILLVPAPPLGVGQSPTYITVGDFNGDKVADAAVTDTAGDRYTVLPGGPLNFSSGAVGQVGNNPIELTAGDINNDGKLDLVVIANTRIIHRHHNALFIVPGQGDGTFLQPLSFDVPFAPTDVAVGNFDNQNGVDVALASRAGQQIAVMQNLGGNFHGFQTPRVFPVARNPVRLLAADMNQDGFTDLITVNNAGGKSDDVSIFLNKAHTGSVDFEFPNSYTVGIGAVDAAVIDFDRNGTLDLLVLNSGTLTNPNQFTVSVLMNQRNCCTDFSASTCASPATPCDSDLDCAPPTPTSGTPVPVAFPVCGSKGTGLFTKGIDVTIGCPADIGGVAISCSPNYITAGDYDGDGNPDFAVSFQTAPQTPGSPPTAGFVNVYAGHGDGTFDFAQGGTQLLVGRNPQQMVSADFTGDGITDVAVAEKGSSSVQLLVSIAPPTPTPTISASPTPTLTRTPFFTATVTQTPTPQPTGRPCSTPHQCAPPAGGTGDGFCVDNVCCNTACPTGRCDICGSVGACTPLRALGQACCQNSDCSTGTCTQSVCAPPQPTPTATPGGPGSPCTSVGDCRSNLFCTNNVCCTVSACRVDQVCAQDGQCHVPPTPTPTPVGQGGPCDFDSDCALPFVCTDGVCCDSTACPEGERCDIDTIDPSTGAETLPGICNLPGDRGVCCVKNTDCASGLICLFNPSVDPSFCSSQTICDNPPAPTPTLVAFPSPTPAAPPVVHTSSGGGCSVAGDGTDATAAWLLVALPLALWGRRYGWGLRPASVRRDRSPLGRFEL